MSSLARTIITKYHRLSSLLTTETYCSQFWKLENPKLRPKCGWVRAPFLVHSAWTRWKGPGISLEFPFDACVSVFIFGCTRCSSCRAPGVPSSWGAGTSRRRAPLAPSAGSRAQLSSGGTRASLRLSMWGPPGPETEPITPTSAGRFFATEPPGSPGATFLRHQSQSRGLHLLA